MTNLEKLEKRVRDSDALGTRLRKCHQVIGKMCSEGRPPKMSIPIQWDDEDFFIGVTLQDAIRELNFFSEKSNKETL